MTSDDALLALFAALLETERAPVAAAWAHLKMSRALLESSSAPRSAEQAHMDSEQVHMGPEQAPWGADQALQGPEQAPQGAERGHMGLLRIHMGLERALRGALEIQRGAVRIHRGAFKNYRGLAPAPQGPEGIQTIHIENDRAEKPAREVAAENGESLTDAVLHTLPASVPDEAYSLQVPDKSGYSFL